MLPMTIDELIEFLADEALRPAISEAVQSWRADLQPVATLFMRIRELVGASPTTSRSDDWSEFEDSVRRHSTVLAPYELARLFGLQSQFEAASYESRRSLIQQLRLDCDFPEAELLALEEQRRLDSLTPQQRLQHESEQAKQRQRRIAIMQQVMQEQQGDARVSGQQARLRAGPPRKMLARASHQQVRNVFRRRGVDLESELALDLEADDVEQAVQFARLLSHDRRCDLFRGQPVDWNPVPGVLRSSIDQQLSNDRWKCFRGWAAAQPALAEFARHPKKLAAIAQHYGVPTYLLDFTRNPRVAAFFATHSDVATAEGPGCIYCLASGALDAAHHNAPGYMRYYEITPQIERVEVDGLFRMQAQEGSFVYANQATWTSFFRVDVIRFPRTERVASPLPGDIYPAVQSEIEQLVADYFSNEPESMSHSPS